MTSVIPWNTFILVVPPANDDILPFTSAGKVWDSLVKNAVTASTPSVPDVPSDPDEPPSNLKILTVSVNPSPDVSIVTGKLAFVFANPPASIAFANVKLPLTTPLYNPAELDVTLPVSKLNPVTPVPCAVVIVTLLEDILAVKFCCAILNIMLDGIASFEEADTNDITCESTVNINDFAVFEAVASFIASWTFSPDSNLNWPLTVKDEPSHVNLSPNEKFDPEST